MNESILQQFNCRVSCYFIAFFTVFLTLFMSSPSSHKKLESPLIMKPGDQADLIIFYLEFLNLLGKRRLNSGALNCGTKLAKT